MRGDVTPGAFGKGANATFGDQTVNSIHSLVSALNKLPPYNGLTFRHDTNFGGFGSLNRPGATITDMAFLSTTREAATLKRLDNPVDILQIIRSKSGRFIKPLSIANSWTADENEVLFKPGARFRVVNRFDATDMTNAQEKGPGVEGFWLAAIQAFLM